MSVDKVKSRSFALTTLTNPVKSSLVLVVSGHSSPHKYKEHLRLFYEPKTSTHRMMLLRKLVTQKKEDTVLMESILGKTYGASMVTSIFIYVYLLYSHFFT